MTVFRAGVLEPVSIEAHEVPKAPRVWIPRVLHECGEARGQCFGHALLTCSIEGAGYEQCAGVVVDAIAVGTIRHSMYRMLEQPGVVAHREQVSELHLRRNRTVIAHCAVGLRRYDSESLLAPNLVEADQVALRCSLPSHRATADIGTLAHALSPRVVREQPRNGIADCL
jgi:hypothetical protein